MIIPIDLNQEGKKMIGNIGRFEAASLQKTTMITDSKEVLEYASDRHFLDNFKEQFQQIKSYFCGIHMVLNKGIAEFST